MSGQEEIVKTASEIVVADYNKKNTNANGWSLTMVRESEVKGDNVVMSLVLCSGDECVMLDTVVNMTNKTVTYED
eukprot:Awhi_evm1s10783